MPLLVHFLVKLCSYNKWDPCLTLLVASTEVALLESSTTRKHTITLCPRARMVETLLLCGNITIKIESWPTDKIQILVELVQSYSRERCNATPGSFQVI